MKVGWDIIDWRFLTRIHRVQREHLLVMLITLGLTVFLDLITAGGDRPDRGGDGQRTAGSSDCRWTAWSRCRYWTGVSSAARDDEDTVDAFSGAGWAWWRCGAALPWRRPTS